MAPTIEAIDVSKTYLGNDGLRGLDLEVSRGSIVGLIGPSGAGKTTAVRVFTGLLRPDAGHLLVLGTEPSRFGSDIRGRIGYLPQESAVYPGLSVRENIDFVAALQGLRGRERSAATDRVLDFVELRGAERKRASDASGGMRRRIALAGALVHDPDLLFLDEPTTGLDPILRRTIWGHFEELRAAGKTLIVTTQNVTDAGRCDQIVLLSEGSVAEVGRPEDIRRKAFGGELVDVTFDRRPEWHEVDAVARAIEALDTMPLRGRAIRYTVVDAGTAIPDVVPAAAEVGIGVTETERVIPDFDDVFVRVVDRERNGDTARGAA